MTTPEPVPPARPGRKRFLTRAAVVQAGLRVVEAEGLPGVTIRRVATEVGAAPMALYRHVADKRELLLAMLEERAAEIPSLPPDGDPAERLVGAMLTIHDYLAEHLWIVDVLREGEIFAPRAVERVDYVLGLLDELGFDSEQAFNAYVALWWFTLGHLATLGANAPERWASRAAVARQAPLERLPHAAAAFSRAADFDHHAAFESGLRALVSGLRQS